MSNLSKPLVLTFLLFTALLPSQSYEQDKGESPYFFVKCNDPNIDQLPLKKTWAEVNITGVIADVTINQLYKNEGQNPLEAVYTFPSSTNAAVYAMEMTIGDRKIYAQIEEKQKARKTYEKSKKEGKRVSLLEQHRPNVFQMNVANILPGDDILVSLKYTEFIVPTNGTYEFVFPTVVGPRYAGESDADIASNEFVSTPYHYQGEASSYDFDMRINLNAGVPIQFVNSATHNGNYTYNSVSDVSIELDKSENKGCNRDFTLEYKLSGEDINTGLMLYEHQDEKFFLMMVQPPKRVTSDKIPPREYIFINDVSGSMRGEPMDISKRIMRNLITNLRPEDSFNVMVFAGASGWMSNESLPAKVENIQRAIDFVDNQSGGGGTRILNALEKALTFPRKDEALSRIFVVVTDGYVSVEKEVFDLIRNNNDNANVFVFGIGSSVNRHLLEGMAHVGMGEPFIVMNHSETNSKAELFRTYISSPVLSQIKLKFNDFEAYDIEPLTIPDVFAQRPILIYGKYRGMAKGTAMLKGFAGRKRWESKINISKYQPELRNSALRYLWARKAIQMLDDYGSLYNETDKEKVTELGLKYNLLTNYTSFIAVEDIPVTNGNLKTVKQPQPLPKNVSNSSIGFEIEVDDEIDVEAISLYKEVEVVSELTENLKMELIKYIDKSLIHSLNECLESIHQIESLLVSVNEDGKVIKIHFEGTAIDETLSLCLIDQIKRWDFKKLNLQGEVKFKIKF